MRKHGARILADYSVAESSSGDGLSCQNSSFHELPEINLSYNRAGQRLFRELEYDLADCDS